VRDRVLVPLLNRAWVQCWATYSTSQLWVNYRRGPLGATRLARKPRPGDRVADLACVRQDGESSRLHAELGGRFVLLTPDTGAAECVSSAERLLGKRVVPMRFVEDRDEVWLVRPDGHLAWRGRDAAMLERWLTDALNTGRTTR